MKNLFRKFAFSSLFAATLMQVGCKEDTIIDANLAPTVGTIAVDTIPDTLTVWTKTKFIDTVVTSLTPANQVVIHGLGAVNDPYFGLTTAGIYLQVIPERGNYTFSANNPTVTDAYLVLPYSGFSWGDTLSFELQNLNVYRVTDNLSTDETYYSNTHKNYDPTPVGSVTGVNIDKLSDSVSVLGVTVAPHLRIKLTDAFKNELVSVAASSNDAAAFVSAIKGLYIASADSKGRALPYFLLNGSGNYRRAAIQFYYTEPGSTETKNTFFNFTNAAAHFNKITRSYSTELKNAFASSAESDPVVYLQNLPGATLDLRFPTLKNLPQVVVNRAELLITEIRLTNDPEADKFWAPLLLDVTGVDADGNKYIPLDKQPVADVGALAFMDGTRKSVALPGGITINQYAINIPREVQRAIVNKTDTLHLQVNGVQRFFGAYRLTAAGSPAAFKVSLRITYSKL